MEVERAVAMIIGRSAQVNNSGMADADVSTVKLEPLSAKSETAVNCVMPSVLCTFSYIML